MSYFIGYMITKDYIYISDWNKHKPFGLVNMNERSAIILYALIKDAFWSPPPCLLLLLLWSFGKAEKKRISLARSKWHRQHKLSHQEGKLETYKKTPQKTKNKQKKETLTCLLMKLPHGHINVLVLSDSGDASSAWQIL